MVTIVSDVPESAHKLHLDKPQDQWLRNLDVDATTSTPLPVPLTPLSALSQAVSTPALPDEIAGTEGTTTPRQFEPDNQEGSRTVSERTYDTIRENFFSL